MVDAQIQFPDPLYRRLKEIADEQSWSLSDVMRKAAEQFVERFPERAKGEGEWQFPLLECGGEFLIDPATSTGEAEAIERRA